MVDRYNIGARNQHVNDGTSEFHIHRAYRIRQNFQGGKLLRLCTKHTIHWKTFAVHQAHAIMYCTQQMIQGENFRDWLKNRESFPLESFAVYGIKSMVALW